MIKKKHLLLLMPLLFAGVLFFGCQQKEKHPPKIFVQLETFQTETGWGYQLKKDEKIYIRQENIPAIHGNQSFETKDDAEKVGRLVLHKLRSKQRPAITINELDSLKINYQHGN